MKSIAYSSLKKYSMTGKKKERVNLGENLTAYASEITSKAKLFGVKEAKRVSSLYMKGEGNLMN